MASATTTPTPSSTVITEPITTPWTYLPTCLNQWLITSTTHQYTTEYPSMIFATHYDYYWYPENVNDLDPCDPSTAYMQGLSHIQGAVCPLGFTMETSAVSTTTVSAVSAVPFPENGCSVILTEYTPAFTDLPGSYTSTLYDVTCHDAVTGITSLTLASCCRIGFSLVSTSMEGTWGCGSNFPISSITQIVAGNDALLPTGTLSSISSDFWDGTLLSSSSNISLFHDPFAIAWQESQIPTLTVWTPEGGPEGAVVSTADTAILSLYTFQFTARLYDEYPLQTTGLNSPPSHNEGKIVGLVLGIVGGVGGLSLLAFGVWLFQRRATKEQRERGNRTPQITEVEAIPPFQQQQQPPQPTLWNKIFGST